MHLEEVTQGGDHVLGTHASLDLDGEAFARVLVDHRHQLQPLSIRGLIHREIVGPDLVPMLGLPAQHPVRTRAQPLPLTLPPRHLQPFSSPQPLHPLPVDPPAFAYKKSMNSPVP